MSAGAQTTDSPDTIGSRKEKDLQEVVVESSRGRRATKVGSDGSVTVDAVTAGQRVRAFGEADALRVIRAIPGVSAGSDYSSGVSVDGGEFSHTFYGVGGAPVFFPYHFGGIFSVFNAEHLPVVRMEKSIHGSDMPGYIGGRIDFSQRERLARRTSGMANLGLIAASATVSTPLGDKADITASGRVSYLNLIYGKLLRDNTTDMGYGFYDFNLTSRFRPAENDRLVMNIFYNRDFLSTDDSRFALATHFRWHNLMGSCEWNHSADKFKWYQTLYCSSFGSSFDMEMTGISAYVRSGIIQGGTRGNGSFGLGASGNTKLLFGGEVLYTSALPQQIDLTGYGDGSRLEPQRDNSISGGVNVAIELHCKPAIKLTAGARVGIYSTGSYHPLYFCII
ncbi:MAG: hypothetical protein K2K97_07465 [Muribaculaceae bacterium]|nr:hypothetical protein [Muribaculaceae bacterium]